MNQCYGFPEMRLHRSAMRSFPPELVQELARLEGVSVLVEEGYGAELGFHISAYMGPNVRIASRDEVLRKSDHLVCITCPALEDLDRLESGQTLFAFLHYGSHPVRDALLHNRGIHCVSWDALQDLSGRRLVVDMEATARNAVGCAIRALRSRLGERSWFDPSRGPIRAYVMGTGAAGRQAIDELVHFGRTGFDDELKNRGGNHFIEVQALGRKQTGDVHFMSDHVLPNADILVAATLRRGVELQSHVIVGEQLERMPPQSVICDIGGYVYDCSVRPHHVKTIQGIPTGQAHDYLHPVFTRDHGAFSDSGYVPETYQLPKLQRRTVVSSYSWPSFGTVGDRRKNVRLYAKQVFPFLAHVSRCGLDGITDRRWGNSVGTALAQALHPMRRIRPTMTLASVRAAPLAQMPHDAVCVPPFPSILPRHQGRTIP